MNQKRNTGSFLDKLFKNILIFLPLGVIGNLIFSYYHTDEGIISYLSRVSARTLMLCLILCVVPWFTHLLRMFIWTRFISHPVKFIQLFKIAVAADLSAAVSPTSVGGGPIKAGMLMQQGLKPADAISLTLLGSVEDYAFFLISVPVSFVITAGWKHHFMGNIVQVVQSSTWILPAVIALISAVLLAFSNKKVFGYIGKLLNRIALIRKITASTKNMLSDISSVYQLIRKEGKRFFLLSLTLTGIHWISRYSILIVLLYGLGFDINPVKIFFLQWVILVLLLFVPTPGATGGAEASFYFIFRNIIPGSTIGFIMPAWRFMTYYLTLGLGTVVFMMLNYFSMRKEKARVEAETPIPEIFEVQKISGIENAG
ncbi:flippase-like domain-containing protein [candidate division KSB1 bacterium]|nr:flippase-like domain-containing protein [candidate division KSB1 bacterium]